MIIKYQDLNQHLQKKMIACLYTLIGPESYIIEDSYQKIKKQWQDMGITDVKTIDVHHAQDWHNAIQETKHYHLFSSYQLLKIRYDKKNLDAASIATIKSYLANPNPTCLLIIEAPLLSLKSLQWLATEKKVVLIQALTLPHSAFLSWIQQSLRDRGLKFETSVPALIHQYNQNNMRGVSQLIEKMSLVPTNDPITTDSIEKIIVDQCTYSLYELADACLISNKNKTLHLLRYLAQNKTEPSLVLWLLTQEIRLLLQWHHLKQQHINNTDIAKQLNIWSNRVQGYIAASQRLSFERLQRLISDAHQIDIQIKSTNNSQGWHAIERLAITFMESI